MKKELPFACDLSAIEAEEREQHHQNGNLLLKSVEEVKETERGYGFRFSPETTLIKRAATFMAFERLCCPFFHFNLEVTPDSGPVWLTISGDKQVRQFIKENILSSVEI